MSVDALKLLSGCWCLILEIVMIFRNIQSRYKAFYSTQTFKCKCTNDFYEIMLVFNPRLDASAAQF